MFTLVDDSEAVNILESKISDLSSSFEALGTIDLNSADASINFLFPTIFGVLTVALVIVIVIHRIQAVKDDALRAAKRVFVEFGALSRPNVIGGTEYVVMHTYIHTS